MLSWISSNIATILITLALIGIVIGIVAVMRKDKKKGKSSCGGFCGHCPMAGKCHSNK
ncbi:MAG: FeoB-associated Cys-rich membrane protein [Christensenella sp.]